MEFKYKLNDYGKLLIQLQDKTPTDRSIFYIHDIYDQPENFKEFIKQLKMFNFYGVFFPMDQTDEKYFNYEGWDFHRFYNYIKDILISLDLKEIYLIGNGFGAAIALMLSQDVKLNFIKLVLINPLVSKISRHTQNKLKNIPSNIDEMYDLMQLTYLENDPVFIRLKEGNEVIDNTRRFVYNHFIYKKIVFDLLHHTINNQLRKLEKKNVLPTLVITSGFDHLFLSSEIESTYRNHDSVSIVNMLDCAHYPWRDNLDFFVESVMKFLFTGEKLYTDNKLPPEYLYQYLAEDIKEKFKNTFGKQILEREKKEAERLSKQVEVSSILGDVAMSEEEVAYYMKFQSETLQASIANAKQYIEEIKNNKEEINEDFITFDQKHHKSNIIYITKEGYNAYHDGQGNNFYQLPNTKIWIPSKYNKIKEN